MIGALRQELLLAVYYSYDNKILPKPDRTTKTRPSILFVDQNIAEWMDRNFDPVIYRAGVTPFVSHLLQSSNILEMQYYYD